MTPAQFVVARHGWLLGLWLSVAGTACGTTRTAEDLGRYQAPTPSAAGAALRVRWSKPLAEEWGGLYVPVERAQAALDPKYDRLFVGSAERVLWSFDATGRRLYQYRTESGIDAAPSVDSDTNELYVPTTAGVVHALQANSGAVRWKADLGGAVSQPGVLSKDAFYVVTDDDSVYALARRDGSVLWRHRREPRAGLKISGHAGILLSEERLITGFGDGTLVALSPGDGRVLWLLDTTLDFSDPAQAELGFVDIDTTPVQVGDTVFAASFAGGFYGVGASDGAVHVRQAELTGVTSLAASEGSLIIASADRGLLCIDLTTFSPRWVRPTRPYVVSTVQVDQTTVYVTQTRGAFLALALADGQERGRLQTEHGFLAAPSMRDGLGFILGNSGVLYAFDY